MTIGPVRHRNDRRPMKAYERGRLFEVRCIAADAAIRPPEILAPRRAKHDARALGLLQPLLHRAVAPHLAACEVDKAHAVAERHVAGDRAAKTDLKIVGMRSEYEEIH